MNKRSSACSFTCLAHQNYSKEKKSMITFKGTQILKLFSILENNHTLQITILCALRSILILNESLINSNNILSGQMDYT